MSQKGNYTNLASEYHVYSILHRLGVSAAITQGNKKAVDIIVERGGKALTIDVKGLQSTGDFIVNNPAQDSNHYIAFVYYKKGEFNNPHAIPEVFIVPSKDLEKPFKELDGKPLTVTRSGVVNVAYASLKKLSAKYQDNWQVFKETLG